MLTARKRQLKIVKISKNNDATPIHAKCIDSRRVGSAGGRTGLLRFAAVGWTGTDAGTDTHRCCISILVSRRQLDVLGAS